MYDLVDPNNDNDFLRAYRGYAANGSLHVTRTVFQVDLPTLNPLEDYPANEAEYIFPDGRGEMRVILFRNTPVLCSGWGTHSGLLDHFGLPYSAGPTPKSPFAVRLTRLEPVLRKFRHFWPAEPEQCLVLCIPGFVMAEWEHDTVGHLYTQLPDDYTTGNLLLILSAAEFAALKNVDSARGVDYLKYTEIKEMSYCYKKLDTP